MKSVKQDFPLLSISELNKPLVYLDSSASTQKPQVVINAIANYYQHDNANVHRGVYALSQRATDCYENARDKVKQFINARSDKEIIFTRGTTESINLAAYCLSHFDLNEGDEILLSALEHHSNIVPWQIACQQTGANLQVIDVKNNGELDLEAYKKLLNHKTKVVALGHVSNALGTINPIKQMTQAAHQVGAYVLIDGAQGAPHLNLDMQALDCDFYAFSAHKLYGPMGVGVLYVKQNLLEELPPYQTGGDMIATVAFDKTTYNGLPHKFEAGTPNVAGAVGLAAAIDYLTAIGMDKITLHEHELLVYATAQLSSVEHLRLVGTAPQKAAVLSFVMDNVHPHDIGTILDHHGVAVRAGHHCAMPLMKRLKVPATVRASLGIYNDKSDIDALVKALLKVNEMFQ